MPPPRRRASNARRATVVHGAEVGEPGSLELVAGQLACAVCPDDQ
jgi:hypothetical protein